MPTKGVYESDSAKKVENISWDEFEIAINRSMFSRHNSTKFF